MPYKDPEKSRQAARERYERNKDRLRSLMRSYYLEHKEEVKAYNKKRFETNRSKILCQQREWYSNNKVKKNEADARWRKINSAKIKLRDQRRRALLKGAMGSFTVEQLEARVAFYGSRCWIPGCLNVYEELDHAIPLSRGGTNWPANLRPICKKHNRQKKDKMPNEFMEWLRGNGYDY